MLTDIADRLVHCRAAGRPPRALPLSELLLEMARDGADPLLLDSIARTVAWHGFFYGRLRGQPFAVFQPVAEEKPAAHLLILMRDGGVSSMLADQPLEATIIDYDNARARIGIELPENLPAEAFNHIRSAVMADFLGDAEEDIVGSADDATRGDRKTVANGTHAQPWR